MEGGARRGAKGMKKRIKICYVYIPAPHKECKLHITHMY